jgi:hypothetical protein
LVSYPTLQRSITFLTRAIPKPLQKRIMGLLFGGDKEMASLHKFGDVRLIARTETGFAGLNKT